MNHLLAFAPAVIALAFCHDFFGVFLGTEGFTGDVVMGLSILIGFCIYFIHFFMRHIPEHRGSRHDMKAENFLYTWMRKINFSSLRNFSNTTPRSSDLQVWERPTFSIT